MSVLLSQLSPGSSQIGSLMPGTDVALMNVLNTSVWRDQTQTFEVSDLRHTNRTIQ
jgi:hypothetical protein